MCLLVIKDTVSQKPQVTQCPLMKALEFAQFRWFFSPPFNRTYM